MRPAAPRARAWIVLIALAVVTFGASTGASFAFPLASSNEFNVVDWELHHLPGKWLYLGGRLVHGQLSTQEEDARVAEFLDLTGRIDRLQHANGATVTTTTELRQLQRERAQIENDVEVILEGRITQVLYDQGLTSTLPLFPNAHWVFPPVDVEFDTAPNELVVSPRDRIKLVAHRPLRHDLSIEKIVAIEADEERGGNRSALIEPLAGVATYPSLVEPDSDYQRLVEIVAHEWVHQYLFFHPLGRNFYSNLELRTLNETVATMAGQELGLLVVVKDPLHPPYDRPAERARQPIVDVDATLRQLRTDVDALLAFGRVDAAEALMEQRRRELARQGVVFRRLNQAFFAFRNVYASEAGSTDPIGIKMAALRIRVGSIGAFLRRASDFSSESDLDRALRLR